MGEAILIIFVFGGVIVITAVVFVIWLAATLLRGTFRLGGVLTRGVLGGGPVKPSGQTRLCLNNRCQARNPIEASFCRRCGQSLRRLPIDVRRVAVL